MIMRRIIFLSLLILMCLPVLQAKRVYVLSIDREIDGIAWRHTRRAIDEMQRANPSFGLFLVHLNTYGGSVDMADSIRTALLRLDMPTVAFIDNNAASAGALIALACDSTYMSQSASIGAATVVNQSGEPMPPKYQNYWSSIMRSTAMSHGKYIPQGDSVARWRRDPNIAADMVIPEKAVAFTAAEAVNNGVADGIASSIDDVLEKLNYTDAEIVIFESTTSDDILGFLASAAVRAVLIMLILGGIYMEMHTPGMGFAAAVSSVAAILYFMPMVVTGTLAPWVLILFILGVVLLALEIFVIPGFGIAGIGGILSVSVSLLGAMIDYNEIEGLNTNKLANAAMVLLSGFVLTLVIIWFLTSKYGPEFMKKSSILTLDKEIGEDYLGVDPLLSELVGKQGITLTDMRPAGKVEIEGNKYDATSTGDFIPSGTPIKVTRYEAAQLYIESDKQL